MYTTNNTNWTTVVVIVLAGFVALGLLLGYRTGPENPYEQQRQAIELKALQDRRAQELTQMQQEQALRSELIEIGTLVLVGVFAGAIIVLAGAGAFLLICWGLAILRMQPKWAGPIRQPVPARRALLFPRAVWRRHARAQPVLAIRRVARW